MRRKIQLILSLLLLTGAVVAQDEPKMRLLGEIHDFGEIKETDGPVSHTFKFMNVGSGALAIMDVKATCGCTLPDWSKKVILPGDTGFVTVQYNPYNRPGIFRKSLTINTNAVEPTSFVYIKGAVKPRPETIIDNLPTEMGALRIRYKSFNLGRMTNEKVFSKAFDVYNQGEEPLTFLSEYEAPDNLKVAFEPMTLEPGELGALTLSYDPTNPELLGFNSHKLIINTDEQEGAEKSFNVLATVEEYFPKLSKIEAMKVPTLTFDTDLYEFGTVDQGEIVTGVFTITNNGVNPLEIRTTRSNCDCTKAQVDRSTIPSGETASLKVMFDTSGRKGNQMKMVTVFSNDPNNPTQTVMLKGKVDFEEID